MSPSLDYIETSTEQACLDGEHKVHVFAEIADLCGPCFVCVTLCYPLCYLALSVLQCVTLCYILSSVLSCATLFYLFYPGLPCFICVTLAVLPGFVCVTLYVLPLLYLCCPVLPNSICVTLCYPVLSVLHIPNSDHPVCLKDDPGSGGESSGLLLSTTESGLIFCKFLLCGIYKHFILPKQTHKMQYKTFGAILSAHGLVRPEAVGPKKRPRSNERQRVITKERF